MDRMLRAATARDVAPRQRETEHSNNLCKLVLCNTFAIWMRVWLLLFITWVIGSNPAPAPNLYPNQYLMKSKKNNHHLHNSHVFWPDFCHLSSTHGLWAHEVWAARCVNAPVALPSRNKTLHLYYEYRHFTYFMKRSTQPNEKCTMLWIGCIFLARQTFLRRLASHFIPFSPSSGLFSFILIISRAISFLVLRSHTASETWTRIHIIYIYTFCHGVYFRRQRQISIFAHCSNAVCMSFSIHLVNIAVCITHFMWTTEIGNGQCAWTFSKRTFVPFEFPLKMNA